MFALCIQICIDIDSDIAIRDQWFDETTNNIVCSSFMPNEHPLARRGSREYNNVICLHIENGWCDFVLIEQYFIFGRVVGVNLDIGHFYAKWHENHIARKLFFFTIFKYCSSEIISM